MKYIQRVYIKGNAERGDEVIKTLTDLEIGRASCRERV